MAEELAGGLCACWLLPLALLGGLVLIANAIGVAWRDRGLERGSVYCAGCRFNLEGCASWNCPECGAHLDEGRVMTPGMERPLPLLARLLLMVGAAAGPLVLVGVLLALVVPINYYTSRELQLEPVLASGGYRPPFEIDGRDESAWYGRGVPERIDLRIQQWDPDHGHSRIYEKYFPPLPDSDTWLVSDELWGRVVDGCGFTEQSSIWLDEARAELVSALRYMAAEVEARPTLTHYHVQENTRRRFDPDPIFVLFEFLFGLVVLGLVIRWTVRWHGRVMAVYVERHNRLAGKVKDWIGRNREKAGLGKSEQ